MEINLEVSEIINDDFSEFIDGNSQLNINEESFLQNQAIVNQSLLNREKEMKIEVIEIVQPLQPPPVPKEEPKPEEKKIDPPPATSKTAWQKVTITKRRTAPMTQLLSGNGENLGNTSSINTSQKAANNNQSLVDKIKEKNQQLMPQNQVQATHGNPTSQAQLITFRVQEEEMLVNTRAPQKRFQSEQLRRNFEQPIEPLPVFDCFYCSQEHFVLNKTNEMLLVKKFAIDVMASWKLQLPLLDMVLHPYLKILRNYDTPEEQDDSQIRIEVEIQSIHHNQRELKHLFQQQQSQLEFETKHLPQTSWAGRYQPKLLNKAGVMWKNPGKTPICVAKPNIKEGKMEHLEKVQSERKNIVNFMDFIGNQSLDESHFGNINIRNTRLKKLANISFESDAHNIYDPYFTSEEELDSISNSDMSDESSSCLESNSSEESERYQSPNHPSQKEEPSSLSSIEREEQDEEEEAFGFSVEDENIDHPTQIQRISSAGAIRNKKRIIATEDDEEGSEKLTFGCTTPQQEAQKMTFNGVGQSISPVRKQMGQTQEGISNQLSPQQVKAVFEQSPIPYQGKFLNKQQSKYQPKQLNQVEHFTLLQEQNPKTSNSALIPLKKIDFHPKQNQIGIPQELESEILVMQQRSYDTDSKIGHILSDLSQPTEESKEKILSDYDEEDGEEIQDKTTCIKVQQNSMIQQIVKGAQSKSFTVTQIGSKKNKHQKLLGDGKKLWVDGKKGISINKQALQQLQNKIPGQGQKFKISPQKSKKEIFKQKNQDLQSKLQGINQQHFVSFDHIQSNSKSQKKFKPKTDNTLPSHSNEDHFSQPIPRVLSSRVDDTLTSQRQNNSTSMSNRIKTQSVIQNSSDFTHLLGEYNLQAQTRQAKQSSLSLIRAAQSQTPVNNTTKPKLSSRQQKKDQILIQGSTPDLKLNLGEYSNGKVGGKSNNFKLSQQELDNLRTTLCSNRYQTTSVQGKLSQFEDKKAQKSGSKSKKHKQKSNKHSECNTVEVDRKMKPKISKNSHNPRSLSKASKNSNLKTQLNYLVENTQERKTQKNTYRISQQNSSRTHNYVTSQDGQMFFKPGDTINLGSKAKLHLNNSQAIKNRKQQPFQNSKKSTKKLNGSIEESHNFLYSIELNQTNQRSSFSMLRQGPTFNMKHDQGGSQCRQLIKVSGNEQTQRFQSSLGPQFTTVSHPQLIMNHTTNLSKSNSNKEQLNKKKKSKVLSNNFVEPQQRQVVQVVKKPTSRTRSHSKASIGPSGSSHQLLLTQQQSMVSEHKLMLKNNQILMSKNQNNEHGGKGKEVEAVKKQKKKQFLLSDNSIHADNKSQTRMISKNDLKISDSYQKGYNNSSKLVLSSVTSPLKAINYVNFQNGPSTSVQPPSHIQPISQSVKESLDFKNTLTNDVLSQYLNFKNAGSKKKSQKQNQKAL